MRAIGYENKNFSLKEPFKGLFTQGMVCHHTYKDESNNWRSPEEVEIKMVKIIFKNPIIQKNNGRPVRVMSKSKENTIDPEKIINLYGADAVRLFILSDSPPEKDVQWSDQGMLSSYKFVQKLFTLNEKIKSIKNNDKTKPSLELSKFINQYLLKIEKNLSNFSYNVIIANIHEAYAFLYQLSKKELNYENLTEDYIKFLVSISPVVPHLSSECLNQLNINKYE